MTSADDGVTLPGPAESAAARERWAAVEKLAAEIADGNDPSKAFEALPNGMKKRLKQDAGKKVRRELALEKGLATHTRELRKIAALRMKRAGASNKEIGELLDVTPSTVSGLIRDSLSSHALEEYELETYRHYFLEDLFQHMELAAESIRNPGYLFDVKGDLVMGPDGQFLQDVSERTKAITEWRHLQESARKLIGVDAPVKKRSKNTVTIRHINAIAEQLGLKEDDDDIVDAELIALPAPEPKDVTKATVPTVVADSHGSPAMIVSEEHRHLIEGE